MSNTSSSSRSSRRREGRTLGHDDRGLHYRFEDGPHAAAAGELEGVREVCRIAHERCAPVPVNDCRGGAGFPTPGYVQHKDALTQRDLERQRTQRRTLVGYGRRRDDYVRVVLVLEALTEDVHVQGPEEAKAAPLPERRRRFAGDFDAAVREA